MTAIASESIRFDFNPRHQNPLAERPVGMRLSYVVSRSNKSLQIEGSVEDPVWKNVPAITKFGIIHPATSARFLFDDKNLYFQVRCAEAPDRTAKAIKRQRDASFAKDDYIYFSIKPDPAKDTEYHFEINAANSAGEARDHDETWNPDYVHKTRRSEKEWVVEAAIPFSIFGLKSPPAQLGFNVGRTGPGLMRRSWFNAMHNSASASALLLDGIKKATSSEKTSSTVRAESNVAVRGDSVVINLPRAYARPQDRWIDAEISLQPKVALAETRLEVKITDLGSNAVLAEGKVVPQGNRGRVSVDLRKLNLTAAEVTLEYFEKDRKAAVSKMLLSARTNDNSFSGKRIKVLIDPPEGAPALQIWPVTFGVPFPAGVLWSTENLKLTDSTGREIPCQKEVTGHWAREGTVKWVRFDALVNPGKGCFVEFKSSKTKASPAVSVVKQKGGTLLLDTGAAQYVLAKGSSPVAEIRLGNSRIAFSEGAKGLYIIDQTGRVGTASSQDEEMKIESAGPVNACVRFEGFYRDKEGKVMARHITRVEAFAGQLFARVTHTLVITEDTNRVWFKEIGWELNADTGDDAEAVFNLVRDNPSKTVSSKLQGQKSIYMLQDSHTRFGAGADSFSVTSKESNEIIAKGKECGDWAALSGKSGGIMIACREAARQHPKEFEINAKRIVIKLFSSRAGEELDFRSGPLAEKWNLTAKQKKAVAGIKTNAAGWSKTHELLISPLKPEKLTETAAELSLLNTNPVYAMVNPEWISQSKAMGPFHPKDSTRFREVETLISKTFQNVKRRGYETGHYGFADYFAGPTYGGSSGMCSASRYRLTYGLRSGAWLVYARSGEREVREFADGTNKAYLDNYLIHSNAPGKIKGVFTGSGDKPVKQLPFYWGRGSRFELGSSSDLNQFLWLYHLTGYRRAGDAVKEYAKGLEAGWVPGESSTWRIIMAFRAITQSYSFTWSPRLRALMEGTFADFTDPEGEILLSKKRPYGSSGYKTQVDVRALIEAAELMAEPKYIEAADILAKHWWDRYVGKNPVNYMNPLGVTGTYLFGNNKDPLIPAGADYALRKAGTWSAAVGTSALASVFESMPYAMGLSLQKKTDLPVIDFRDYGSHASVMVQKTDNGIVDLIVRTSGGEFGSQFEVRPVGIKSNFGMAMLNTVQKHRGSRKEEGVSRVHIPKDAPAGAYELVFNLGKHFVLSKTNVPMVLHASSYWMLPDLNPAKQIFFKVPEKCDSPEIFFEGKAKLFKPDGSSFGTSDGMKGWVKLPKDIAGLWSFLPLENRLVKSRGIPPFFAFGRPEFYFEPPVRQQAKSAVDTKAYEAKDLFVPGRSGKAGDSALHLAGKRTFLLEAGPAHANGDGGQFLLSSKGTIEFFFRPNWSSFDLGEGNIKMPWLQTLTKGKVCRSLTYRIDPNGTRVSRGPRDPSHSFYGSLFVQTKPKSTNLRVWRTESLFEEGVWSHIVWSWGPEIIFGPHGEKEVLMTMSIYVNGKGKRKIIFRKAKGLLPADIPQQLLVHTLRGAVDELRISDVQRYREDFKPLPANFKFKLDPYTRALFHFDKTLEGNSANSQTAAKAVVKP
ncbi:MAG: exo-rhamnogalacturonan lyase family protein [Planctomycetota bacterium]